MLRPLYLVEGPWYPFVWEACLAPIAGLDAVANNVLAAAEYRTVVIHRGSSQITDWATTASGWKVILLRTVWAAVWISRRRYLGDCAGKDASITARKTATAGCRQKPRRGASDSGVCVYHQSSASPSHTSPQDLYNVGADTVWAGFLRLYVQSPEACFGPFLSPNQPLRWMVRSSLFLSWGVRLEYRPWYHLYWDFRNLFTLWAIYEIVNLKQATRASLYIHPSLIYV
jgi:hypothetical protein